MIQDTSYFIDNILKSYRICDTRYKLFYLQYHEPLQDMWYKVLVILFTISWNFTGYVIQGTSYFIYNIIKLYRICDTRYQLFYLQYHETLQDMWIYIIDKNKTCVSRYTCYAQTWIYCRNKRIFSGVYWCITWTNSLTNKYRSKGLLCKFVSELVQIIH